mmetsp:Transcript_13654/g.27760  ORF Transcript_13654/g.27760 Transcript_13654/m.27760 type:complete len:128 (+) Transcript_13654:138-521(+)
MKLLQHHPSRQMIARPIPTPAAEMMMSTTKYKPNTNTRTTTSKDPPSNASNDDDINDEEQEVVHIPPKIAFQIFELIELKRRCKGLYRRHQEKRRQSVIKANNASYHSVPSAHSSIIVLTGDGELFV